MTSFSTVDIIKFSSKIHLIFDHELNNLDGQVSSFKKFMNKKLILNLFASSSIFTSLMSTLGVINPAHASVNLTQRLIHTDDGRTCITNPHGLKDFVCIRDSERDPKAAPAPKSMVVSAKPSDNTVTELDFTDEESETAIK